MLKGLWLRYDIPYGKDAKLMRSVLAYADPHAPDSFGLLKADGMKNIPEAADFIYKEAEKRKILLDKDLVMVVALDQRHMLAGYVRDEADKRKTRFSRHIPDILKLPESTESAYENFDTGSSEDNCSEEEVKPMIIGLNNEANGSYNSGELLEAMGPLRHALWLSLRHYGWRHPSVVYTLRNLGYVMGGTGNLENAHEVMFLSKKIVSQWKQIFPDRAVFSGSESLVEELAAVCAKLGGEKISEELRQLKARL